MAINENPGGGPSTAEVRSRCSREEHSEHTQTNGQTQAPEITVVTRSEGSLTAASGASFLAQSDPIPVRQQSITGTILQPKKIAVIETFTRELAHGSIPAALQVVSQQVDQSFAVKVDTLAFDAVPADDTRPAGLRYNIAATTASTATPPSEAMSADLGGLTASVSAVAGGNEIVFVAAPAQANAIKLRYPNFQFPVFPSAGLAGGVVIAIATNALVTAIDPTPRVETSNTTVLVMNDAPDNVSSGGTMASGTTLSMYQTDGVALKLRLFASWALRSSAGLAWTQSVTW